MENGVNLWQIFPKCLKICEQVETNLISRFTGCYGSLSLMFWVTVSLFLIVLKNEFTGGGWVECFTWVIVFEIVQDTFFCELTFNSAPKFFAFESCTCLIFYFQIKEPKSCYFALIDEKICLNLWRQK